VISSSLGSVTLAQNKSVSMFRLHFRMHESGSESKTTTLNYVLVVQSGSRGKINASRRLPYYSKDKELHTVALGSIIECNARDAETGVQLDCAFESSYIPRIQPARQRPIGFPPILHSRQVQTTAVIPLGSEVRIALFDDPSSGNRLQIVVSAERFAGSIAAENIGKR
jgi:hypothetical protein